MLRKYSRTFALLTVATLLFMGDVAMHVLAPDLEKYFEAHPVQKSLLWWVLAFCLAAAIFEFVREHNSAETADGEKTHAAPATEADRENRRRMLARVRRNWVEGVLHQSLWNQARLILNLEDRPDAVVRPCDLALRRAGHQDTPIPPGTRILDIYRREQEELLLLGEPGSGKTTLLLEIAEALLQEAAGDPSLPIPVVFNLSAWRKGHDRLDSWLVEQLNQDYGVPVKIGKRWVESGALLLLLDGLDEVAEDRRAACVRAINAYRRDHQAVLRPMVVCCRTQEYESIPDLHLGGAVVVQPLTRHQVDDYLKAGGKPLTGLRAVLKDEEELYRELFSTPLMLHVAVMTYADQSAAELRREVSFEERRKRLWDAYIERMFERKLEKPPRYETAEALAWLTWLGNYLTCKDLQKYLIENMQPDDLHWTWQIFAVRWTLAILLGATAFVMDLPNIRYKVMTSLIFVCFGYSQDIELQPIRRLSLRKLRYAWKSILAYTVFGALVGVVATAVAMAGHAAVVAAFVAALGGTYAALTEAFEESVLENSIRSNEGIRYSLRTAAFGAVFGMVFGMVFGAAFEWASRAAFVVANREAVIGGVVTGALLYGGKTAFQHYLLRLLLWRSGLFPRDITAFLDWSAQRALVQRVGGGWRFVHRTLQERFAERYHDSRPDPHP